MYRERERAKERRERERCMPRFGGTLPLKLLMGPVTRPNIARFSPGTTIDRYFVGSNWQQKISSSMKALDMTL